MITHPVITEADLIESLREWGQFWPAPFALKDGGNVQQWAAIYARGLNTSPTARKHWQAARVVVLATCDRFPYPVDVIKAAQKIENETDVAIEAKRSEQKRAPVIRDPAARRQVSELLRDFKVKEGAEK
jgi:hypothetical protein